MDAGLITRAHQAETAVTGERAVTLTAAQAAAVLRALADAEVYCRQRAAAWCADCESFAGRECTDHMDDLEAADACGDLAAGLAPSGRNHPREAVMRDPHIYVDKTPMPEFGHPAMRALIMEATGSSPMCPKRWAPGAVGAARSLGPVLVRRPG